MYVPIIHQLLRPSARPRQLLVALLDGDALYSHAFSVASSKLAVGLGDTLSSSDQRIGVNTSALTGGHCDAFRPSAP